MNLDKINPNWELEINSEHRNRHENLAFDIDVWYPLFEDITFKTYFLPLTREEAASISNYYSYRYLSRKVFTYTDVCILNNLEKRIDTFISSKPDLKEKGAFFRLCGRSAKDGDPLESKKILEEYQENLKKMKNDYGMDPQNGTTKLNAIAKTHWLKVNNGNETLSMMVTSERVFNDMKDWLKHGGKEQIAFRVWDEKLDYDNEYRGYVYENKLAAISQYDHYGRYQHVIDDKEKVEKLINEYWLKEVKLKNRMKYTDYAIDFGYIDGKIIMIELSPYLRCTGTAMYKWDRDGEELRYGNGKLRVNETEYKEINDLAQMWEERYESTGNYKDYYARWSISDYLYSWWKYFTSKPVCYVFVVSVLKKGFWWNSKYLNNGQQITEGLVDDYEIIIDENGMGWIVPEKGKTMKGELWKVTEEECEDIRYFYGEKECERREIKMKGENGIEYDKVRIYVRIEGKTEKDEIIQEYTIETQKNKYNPVGHKIKIEEKYLKCSLRFPLEKKD